MYFEKTSYLCSRFKNRGVEQLVARQAHNLEVARSNPASATTEARRDSGFVCFFDTSVVNTRKREPIGSRFLVHFILASTFL